jgi:GNAT superfamily N-acetyltransferase
VARIDVEMLPVAASSDAITVGLRAFNAPHMTHEEPSPFNVVLRDDQGAIVGGCMCETRWQWLFVDRIWVSQNHRGAGFGSALLEAAEDAARARGCTRAYLDTLSFQAKPFYEKLGWQLFGTQHDYPPGLTRYFLQKDLTQTS